MGLVNYIQETKSELKHVGWPTQKQAVNFTAIVIIFSVLIAVLLGVFDGLFTFLLEKLINIIH